MRAAIGQYTFGGGEFSPLHRNRSDLAAYGRAVREMVNMLPTPQGPATRRPGTVFQAQAKTPATVLIPFVFSTDQSYVIEAGPGYFRYFAGSGGRVERDGVPVETATPFDAVDLPRLRWAQSADVLLLAAPGKSPKILARRSAVDWTLAEAPFTDGPYLDQNQTDTTLTVGGTTAAPTLTASTDLWTAADVGRHVRVKSGDKWGWCRVTAVRDPRVVDVTAYSATGTAATRDWRLGAWWGTTWPEAVCFHENRLCFAAGQTVWLSKSGDFFNFEPTTALGVVADDAAVTLSLADDQANLVRWLASVGGALVAGTHAGPFAIQANALGDALTPLTAVARRLHIAGAADLPPARLGPHVAFVSRTGKKLHLLSGDWTAEGAIAPDLARAGDHLASRGIASMAWQQEPWSTLWMALADGLAAAMTYDPEGDALAWSRHPIGGLRARALSVACVPGKDRDEVWFVVAREIGGVEVAHVEKLAPAFRPPEVDDGDRSDCLYMDAASTYRGLPATVVSGLGHLEGMEVAVLADGASHPSVTVAGGAITLQTAASLVHVGLPIVARLVGLDPSVGAADGSTTGRPRRVDKVHVTVVDSVGGRVGLEGQPLETLPVRRDGDPLGSPPPLRTVTRAVTVAGSWERALNVVVEQPDPLPLTVAAIVPRVTVSG